jgi:hypothetical protein
MRRTTMETDYLNRWRIVAASVATAIVIFGIFAAPLHSMTFKMWDLVALAVLVAGEVVGRVVQRKRADW